MTKATLGWIVGTALVATAARGTLAAPSISIVDASTGNSSATVTSGFTGTLQLAVVINSDRSTPNGIDGLVYTVLSNQESSFQYATSGATVIHNGPFSTGSYSGDGSVAVDNLVADPAPGALLSSRPAIGYFDADGTVGFQPSAFTSAGVTTLRIRPVSALAAGTYTFTPGDGNNLHGFSFTDSTGSPAVIEGSFASVTSFTLTVVDPTPTPTPSPTATSTPNAVPTAAIVGRSIFYNQSGHDANGAGPAANDDAARPTGKSVLLPSATPPAISFANYSSYSRGINGLFVDILNLPGTPAAADFRLQAAPIAPTPAGSPTTWADISIVPTIAVRTLATPGVSRVTIILPGNPAVAKTWLRVTVKAGSANTGLAANDVFYFGNAIGETGTGTLTVDTLVNASDVSRIRNNQVLLGGANVENAFDINRDRAVNATDVSQVRNNQTTLTTRLNQTLQFRD